MGRGNYKRRARSTTEYGYSHLGGSALSLVGNLAGKVVANAIKSDAATKYIQSQIGDVNREIGNQLKSQAVGLAHGHVDNLANALQKRTGVKVDTNTIKQSISQQANKIQLGGSQIGGGIQKYGGAFPLQLVGSLAGKLVSTAAKSGVADKLIRGVQANASSIGKAMVAEAKSQAVNIANQHIDTLASRVGQNGIKIDTSTLKKSVEQRIQS